MAVQVNGKMRGTLKVKADAEQEYVAGEAQKLHSVSNVMQGKIVTKVIYIANKVINLICDFQH